MQLFINGKTQEFPETITVKQALAQLRLDASHVVVELNLNILASDTYATTRLKGGDRLEIVRLVGGG
jgi:thiamine biosynthesis protein ThiS